MPYISRVLDRNKNVVILSEYKIFFDWKTAQEKDETVKWGYSKQHFLKRVEQKNSVTNKIESETETGNASERNKEDFELLAWPDVGPL